MLTLVGVVCLIFSISGSELPLSEEQDVKIVGGSPADIKDFPYQVSLQANGNHECGGTILDQYTILTAAHCTSGLRPTSLSVRVGSTSYRDGGQLIRVKLIRQHKNYDSVTMNNDLSILKLKQPLKLNNFVKPIPLYPGQVWEGTNAIVTGWGVLKAGDQTIPQTLLQVTLQVLNNQKCKDMYMGEQMAVTDNMLCAQTIGKDSCQGDSGGPLVADGKLIGVVSWGFGCADENYPGVYVRISKYLNWIQENRY